MTLRFMKSFLALFIVSAFAVTGAPAYAEASAADKGSNVLAVTTDEDGVNDPLERIAV